MALVAAALLVRAGWERDLALAPVERVVPPAGAARLLYGAKLDPNLEAPEVLRLLPGIGPARAAAIVAARPICSVADLDRIPGVGPVTTRRLAPHLSFDDLPDDCEQASRPIGH